MPSRRPRREDLLPLCSDLGPGDGTDPRLTRRAGRRGDNRKARQLCDQAARALEAALAASLDDVLRDLAVAAVVPAPSSTRLLVTLAPAPSAAPWGAAEVLEHVGRAAGRLRCEVAAAIHRKKAPELAFRLMT
jgi:ribosome-binding factor A